MSVRMRSILYFRGVNEFSCGKWMFLVVFKLNGKLNVVTPVNSCVFVAK